MRPPMVRRVCICIVLSDLRLFLSMDDTLRADLGDTNIYARFIDTNFG